MKAAIISNKEAKYAMGAPAVAGGFVAVHDEVPPETLEAHGLPAGIWHYALLPGSWGEGNGVHPISLEELRRTVADRAQRTRAWASEFPEVFTDQADAWEEMLKAIDDA